MSLIKGGPNVAISTKSINEPVVDDADVVHSARRVPLLAVIRSSAPNRSIFPHATVDRYQDCRLDLRGIKRDQRILRQSAIDLCRRLRATCRFTLMRSCTRNRITQTSQKFTAMSKKPFAKFLSEKCLK